MSALAMRARPWEAERAAMPRADPTPREGRQAGQPMKERMKPHRQGPV